MSAAGESRPLPLGPAGGVLRSLCRIQDRVSWIGFLMAVLALLVILFGYLIEVVARYGLNSPTSWSNEVVAYMLCYCTFLGLPEVTRERGHVAVTTLLELLPTTPRRIMELLIAAAGVAFCGLATWITLVDNVRLIETNVLTVAENPIPKWWITICITFGLGMSTLYFLRQLVGLDGGRQESNSVV